MQFFYQQYERTTANDFNIFTMTSFLIDTLLKTEKKGNFYKLPIRLIFLRQSVFNGVMNMHM